MTDKQLEEEFTRLFGKLGKQERDSLVELLLLFEGGASQLNTARIVLARLEAESEKLTAEECAEELARYEFDVKYEMTPESPSCNDYIRESRLDAERVTPRSGS
jgi:hypothetical protein